MKNNEQDGRYYFFISYFMEEQNCQNKKIKKKERNDPIN